MSPGGPDLSLDDTESADFSDVTAANLHRSHMCFADKVWLPNNPHYQEPNHGFSDEAHSHTTIVQRSFGHFCGGGGVRQKQQQVTSHVAGFCSFLLLDIAAGGCELEWGD